MHPPRICVVQTSASRDQCASVQILASGLDSIMRLNMMLFKSRSSMNDENNRNIILWRT